MKSLLKILLICAFFLPTVKAWAQNETYLQPITNLLSVNSAFAGYNNNTSFNTGNQYYHLNENRAYNLFYATYDKYSKKMRGGIGFTFQHGIIGEQNISTTELGFSYAPLRKKMREGQIIGSLHLNALIATKQWYTYILDKTLVSAEDEPSPPGKKFTRYNIVKPGAAFLFDLKSVQLGISATFPFQSSMASDGGDLENTENPPFNLSLYLAKKMGGNRNGLKSTPYKVIPEFMLFYNKDYTFSRLHVKMDQLRKSFGLFIQSDYTNKIHCLGATGGYRHGNTKINLNAGVGIPGISDDIGAIIELSLNVTVPPGNYSKINPWAPKRN